MCACVLLCPSATVLQQVSSFWQGHQHLYLKKTVECHIKMLYRRLEIFHLFHSICLWWLHRHSFYIWFVNRCILSFFYANLFNTLVWHWHLKQDYIAGANLIRRCRSKSLSQHNTRLSTSSNTGRDEAKQPRLKNQLIKSHESSLPPIGRDSKSNERCACTRCRADHSGVSEHAWTSVLWLSIKLFLLSQVLTFIKSSSL